MVPGFVERLRRAGPAFFAVDEAHCISQWGHDFRPEYRQLRVLKATFPGTAVHAYTATATPQVRDDIVAELGLENPVVLVGTVDRPNLIYRAVHTRLQQGRPRPTRRARRVRRSAGSRRARDCRHVSVFTAIIGDRGANALEVVADGQRLAAP